MVILLAGLCCLLWGSAYPAIKNGYALFSIAPDDIASKSLFAGYRFVVAGLLLLVMALLTQRQILGLSLRQVRQITTLGVTQTALQYVFFYIGLAYTTGVKGSIMNATGTFFSVLLAHFIYKNDRLSWHKVIGCTVGFIGVMVVNFNQGLLDFHFTLLGEGFVVIAALILSAASIYGRQISQTMDSIVLTGYQLTIGGVVLILGGYGAGGMLAGFTFQSSALLAYLALLSSVAFAIWTILLKYNRVGMVTIFNFLIPIFGALLSAAFLGERILEWKNVIALALVCSGIFLVTQERRG
ncbi:DMT family transporter [Rhodoferax sp.]|uniref:DMT family transporter n=1 Tax=Rhodoferax sp. TaxID=50421 RepID=UPI0025E32AE9|nr:DMT family transporter [Rhodoferax sp.]